jgi:hypothetical protein
MSRTVSNRPAIYRCHLVDQLAPSASGASVSPPAVLLVSVGDAVELAEESVAVGDGEVAVADAEDGGGVEFWVVGDMLPSPVVTVGAGVVGWRVVGCGEFGAVDEGTVPTVAPDELVLAVVPVSDAVAGFAAWLADCEGPSVLLVSDDGWPPELSSSATTAATTHTARPAPKAMSLRLVNGELVVRSVPGSWGCP